MAGIAAPTALLLIIIMPAFIIARYVYNIPLQIERVVVFPMAVVPNLWGVWNILYIALLWKRHMSIGLFGAGLPLLLAPAGYAVTQLVGFALPLPVHIILPFALPVALVVYYLAWKYIVGTLNAIIGIA